MDSAAFGQRRKCHPARTNNQQAKETKKNHDYNKKKEEVKAPKTVSNKDTSC